MNTLLETLFQVYLIPALGLIITTVVSAGVSKYKASLDSEEKRNIAHISALYVEQVFKELDGPMKMQKAIEEFVELCNASNIPFTHAEAHVLIEAVVAGFNMNVKIDAPSEVLELISTESDDDEK